MDTCFLISLLAAKRLKTSTGSVRKLFPSYTLYDIDNKLKKFQAMFNEHIFYTNELKRALPIPN